MLGLSGGGAASARTHGVEESGCTGIRTLLIEQTWMRGGLELVKGRAREAVKTASSFV